MLLQNKNQYFEIFDFFSLSFLKLHNLTQYCSFYIDSKLENSVREIENILIFLKHCTPIQFNRLILILYRKSIVQHRLATVSTDTIICTYVTLYIRIMQNCRFDRYAPYLPVTKKTSLAAATHIQRVSCVQNCKIYRQQFLVRVET